MIYQKSVRTDAMRRSVRPPSGAKVAITKVAVSVNLTAQRLWSSPNQKVDMQFQEPSIDLCQAIVLVRWQSEICNTGNAVIFWRAKYKNAYNLKVNEPISLKIYKKVLDRTTNERTKLQNIWTIITIFKKIEINSANYMLWRLVQEIGMETNQQMNYLSYEFFKVLYGTSEPQPRH